MKTQKTLLVILFLVFSCISVFSQQDSLKKIPFRGDTLIVGNYYSIFLKMEGPYMVKLLALEDEEFIVYNERDVEKIDTSKIISILDPASYLYSEYKETNRIGKNKKYFFIGAAYLFTRSESNNTRIYKNGFNLNLAYMVTFSESFGLRTDLDFNHLEKENSYYSYNYNYGSTNYYGWFSYSDGASNEFLFRTNAVIGSLNPEHAVQIYLMPSIGTGLSFRTKENYSYSYNSGPVYSSSYGGGTGFCLGVSLGAGFNVKFSNKIRGFAEFQYNAWYLGDNGPPEFSALKLGIIL